MEQLRARFLDLWARMVQPAGGEADAEATWRALDAGYGAAGRHYHGWDHVADLLAGHDAVRDEPDFAGLDHDALDLAIVFHDAVYETDRSDAVLGAAPPVYAAYAAAIRREYAAVPEAIWRLGRAGVLERFLARPRLYQTRLFQKRLELLPTASSRLGFRDAT